MDIPFSKRVFTEEETNQVAALFTPLLKDGDIVVLNGNLGAGKTFFIKSILKNFNYSGVNSPTFAIVNEYNNSKKIYHFDFYRIEEEKELYDIGFDEYMSDPEAVKFIEWGNLFPEMIPLRRKEINIIINEDQSRDFIITEHV